MIVTFSPAALVGNLKAALLAACEDQTRPHLACVRLELAKSRARFVATNGHWLWMNEIQAECIIGVDEKGREVLDEKTSAVLHLPIAEVAKMHRAINLKKAFKDHEVLLDTEARVLVQDGQPGVVFSTADVQFPPYGQIVPQLSLEGSRLACGADAAYLEAIARAFAFAWLEKPSEAVRSPPVLVHNVASSQRGPIVMTSQKVPHAVAVLMPCVVDGAQEHSVEAAERARTPLAVETPAKKVA